MSLKRVGLTTGLVAAMVLGTSVPAMAQTEETGERHRPRLERFCENVPDHIERVEERLARIQGDADTRGSIAWLEVKQAEAEEAGRDNLATMIGHRIAIKTELIDVLEARLAALADAEVFCEELPEEGSFVRHYF
ncbi:MAG: hypothetical protein L0Z49_06385 [Actinobacteria bacterium]|nr:hypothetical protein [Actinomycetota bacterium]MCI0544059.1 hypothetical protein [Actinomycetota bacterium]MCI0679439.1 hypothetical protein [Actinomycetota bacterium]